MKFKLTRQGSYAGIRSPGWKGQGISLCLVAFRHFFPNIKKNNVTLFISKKPLKGKCVKLWARTYKDGFNENHLRYGDNPECRNRILDSPVLAKLVTEEPQLFYVRVG